VVGTTGDLPTTFRLQYWWNGMEWSRASSLNLVSQSVLSPHEQQLGVQQPDTLHHDCMPDRISVTRTPFPPHSPSSESQNEQQRPFAPSYGRGSEENDHRLVGSLTTYLFRLLLTADELRTLRGRQGRPTEEALPSAYPASQSVSHLVGCPSALHLFHL